MLCITLHHWVEQPTQECNWMSANRVTQTVDEHNQWLDMGVGESDAWKALVIMNVVTSRI